MNLWRLIVDGRRPGAVNMALDEALMTVQEKRSLPPTLRLYGWDPPCVSLGYFQRAQSGIDLEACARAGVDVVRRPTGGRAVLHDAEVTYCLVTPQDMLPGSILETYRLISGGLLQGLAYLGINGQLAQPGRRAGPGGHSAGSDAGVAWPDQGAPGGACFDSPSWYETVVGGRKILGSAQTRRNGVILQHGSLLLSFDPGKLAGLMRSRSEEGRERLSRRLRAGVTSVSEQLGRTLRPGEVETALVCGMAKALDLRIVRAGYALEELELTRGLFNGKYKTREWTFRR